MLSMVVKCLGRNFEVSKKKIPHKMPVTLKKIIFFFFFGGYLLSGENEVIHMWVPMQEGAVNWETRERSLQECVRSEKSRLTHVGYLLLSSHTPSPSQWV